MVGLGLVGGVFRFWFGFDDCFWCLWLISWLWWIGGDLCCVAVSAGFCLLWIVLCGLGGVVVSGCCVWICGWLGFVVLGLA